MHFKNSAVSEVPAPLIFLKLKTETEVSSYLRPHNVKKVREVKIKQSVHMMLEVQFLVLP